MAITREPVSPEIRLPRMTGGMVITAYYTYSREDGRLTLKRIPYDVIKKFPDTPHIYLMIVLDSRRKPVRSRIEFHYKNEFEKNYLISALYNVVHGFSVLLD